MADYYLQQEQHRHEAEIIVVPAPGDRPRQLFLDAGRALMLCGALAVVSTTTTHAFIGFLSWIVGVSLLALLPVASRFAPAVVLAVALASSLFKYFFAPWY